MKIYGIGTDIANINRLKKSIINKKFIDRIFNKNEVIRCNKQVNKVNCYSKRFAAKEAFGKPSIRLIGNTKKKVKEIFKNKKFNIFLSLSDEKPFAIATAIISL